MKEIVEIVINKLELILERLKLAYDETWGIEDLMAEFQEEVEIRKAANKENFIGFVAGFYATETARQGLYMSEEMARELAEKKFEVEKKNGKFDELYNLKGE